MYNNQIYLPLILLLSFNLNAQVAIEKIDDNWNLMVNGKPFEVKGATFGYDKEIENYDQYFQDLKFLGVNTIRLWATNENTKKLLDAAQIYTGDLIKEVLRQIS